MSIAVIVANQPINYSLLTKQLELLPKCILEHILEYNAQHREKMRDTISILHLIAYTPYYTGLNYFDNMESTDRVVHRIHDLKYTLKGEMYQLGHCLCCQKYKTADMLLNTIRNNILDQYGRPIYSADHLFCAECYEVIYKNNNRDTRIHSHFDSVEATLRHYGIDNVYEDDDDYSSVTDTSGWDEWNDAMEREAEFQEDLRAMDMELE
jgi:hypothetical protein